MRKAKPKKHVILPDPVYGDVKVTKFVNNLMYDGKKSVAYSIFYNALTVVQNKMKDAEMTPVEIWKKALDNITPQVEVKSRRIGGATFQVPTEIRPDRKEAIRYAIDNGKRGDIIVLAGKGHEDYQVIGHEKIHMDEREIVAEYFSK